MLTVCFAKSMKALFEKALSALKLPDFIRKTRQIKQMGK